MPETISRTSQKVRREMYYEGRGNTVGGVSPPPGDPYPYSHIRQMNHPFPDDIIPNTIEPGFYAQEMQRTHNTHRQPIHELTLPQREIMVPNTNQNRGESTSRSTETSTPDVDKKTKKRIMFVVLLISTLVTTVGAWLKYKDH